MQEIKVGVFIISQCDEDGNQCAVAAGFSYKAAMKLYEVWKKKQNKNPHYWWDIPPQESWVTMILTKEILEQILKFEEKNA